jgi:hypothetical protein
MDETAIRTVLIDEQENAFFIHNQFSVLAANRIVCQHDIT